ncbi:transketolase C-terminal domain-containing protein, partial [Asanoa sp. NPDC049573]|uniref:transketolase C-terminal domain-containing protein n=1 Tax=Asanoa sp. NPDC049573 TaxID=3155396 RepID=UPI00342AE806
GPGQAPASGGQVSESGGPGQAPASGGQVSESGGPGQAPASGGQVSESGSAGQVPASGGAGQSPAHGGTGQVAASGGAGPPEPGAEGVLVLAVGPLAAAALVAAERLDAAVTVVDPRWLLPVDPELVAAAAGQRLVVTVEDNGAHGGYGDAVSRALRGAGSHVPVRSLALPQRFLAHGSRSAILKARGLDAENIADAVRRELPRT